MISQSGMKSTKYLDNFPILVFEDFVINLPIFVLNIEVTSYTATVLILVTLVKHLKWSTWNHLCRLADI